jgi:hypothetical protein
VKSSMVVTWRKHTAAQKKAYRARQNARRGIRHNADGAITLLRAGQWELTFFPTKHHFGDNFGSRVPTAELNGERL